MQICHNRLSPTLKIGSAKCGWKLIHVRKWSMAFTASIFTKWFLAGRNYVEIHYTTFHLNMSGDLESTDKNSLTTLRKVMPARLPIVTNLKVGRWLLVRNPHVYQILLTSDKRFSRLYSVTDRLTEFTSHKDFSFKLQITRENYEAPRYGIFLNFMPPNGLLTGVGDLLCLCEISGFYRGDYQAFALLGCYTAYVSRCLPTFR